MQPRALHLSSRPAFPPIRSKTACRAEGGKEGTTHLLIQLTIEEKHGQRWCLWRPDHGGFNSRSIFSSWHSRADHRNDPNRITNWVQDVRYHLIEVLDR